MKRVILDASGAQLENALKAKPFAIHLNLEEAQFLYKTSDYESILQDLGKRVQLVALTAGKEGLYLYIKEFLFKRMFIFPKLSVQLGAVIV